MRLTFEGDDTWRVGFDDEAVVRYRWDELRFSVSWKAYCLADEAERLMVAEHTDDLTRRSGHGRAPRRPAAARAAGRTTCPAATELALLLIDEYVRFPAPSAGAAA